MNLKRPIVLALTLAIFAAPVLAQPTGFSDVPDDHTNREDILYASRKGWFEGYEDGTFRPNQKISTGQLGAVVSRAFPDGETRGRIASFMRAGEAGLATPDLADPPDNPTPGQTNKGRTINAELPVLQVRNLPYGDPDTIYSMLENCHITHNQKRAGTINNLRNACRDMAKDWFARWAYIPLGFDTSNLFLHANLDGEPGRVPILERGRSYWATPCDGGPLRLCRPHTVGVENLEVIMVRDVPVPGKRPDVIIECIKWSAWSEPTVRKISDIPRENCLPEEDGQ